MKKKLISVVFMLITSVGLFAQSDDNIQQKYNSYMEKRAYLSCYRYLEDVDQDNEYPDVFALKVNLILGYYVTSIRHSVFSLKDLKPSENLGELRAKGVDAELVYFPIVDNAKELLEKYPNSGTVYHSLGIFYYDILAKYGNQVEEFGNPARKAFENFKAAINKGWNNPEELWEPMAKAALAARMFDESVLYFGKILSNDRENPLNQYQMALALYFVQDFNGALPFAEYAEKNAGDELKEDAQLLLADIFLNKKEYKKALRIYISSYDNESPNLFTLRKIVVSSLYAKDKRTAFKYADIFAEICSEEDIQKFSTIYPFFINNGFDKEYLEWTGKLKREYSENDSFMGIIYYYEANYYLGKESRGEALLAIQNAMSYFKDAFGVQHPVFTNLNKMKEAALAIAKEE